jgi:predicted membrane channel-forming protein YqfA (hemolysin III family)
MVYEYTYAERILMAITTALSNVSTIPGLCLMKYQGRIFSYYFSIFGIIVSFMYHLCESLDIIIIIPQLKWHELDNIGALYCLNNLMLSFTKSGLNIEEIERKNQISTLLILIIQKRGPWDLTNTIIPIVVCGLYVLYHLMVYGIPTYYKPQMIKGLIFFGIGVIFFIRGLDDLNDYIRIYHTLWHIFIGIAFYYLWQIQYKNYVSYSEIYKYALKEILSISDKNLN